VNLIKQNSSLIRKRRKINSKKKQSQMDQKDLKNKLRYRFPKICVRNSARRKEMTMLKKPNN
jgi:hypothetical protein